MIPLLWIKAAIATAAFAAVASLAYIGYAKIKHIGYVEAEAKYELVLKEYREGIAAKVDSIEKSSNLLVEQTRLSDQALSKSLADINKGLKGKTLTIIKDGKCTPSDTFMNSFNAINSTVNQNIKGK